MLRICCFLTGDDYKLVSIDTPQSKIKVSLMATALLIPVLIWLINGFLLSFKVFGSGLEVAIVVSLSCAVLIFLVERLIVMSPSNRQMKRFRIVMGIAVAFIGTLALDEVIFEKDITHQVELNRKKAGEKARKDALAQFDEENNMSEAEHALVQAKSAQTASLQKVMEELDGKGSGVKGVGRIANKKMELAKLSKMQMTNAQSKLDSLIVQRGIVSETAEIKAIDDYESGLMMRVQALFQLVFNSPFMGITYLVLTILMFCMEFIVVLVKANAPETNYERKLKMIEQIGQRRMAVLMGAASPLTDPSYYLPNAVAARDELNKKSMSIFN